MLRMPIEGMIEEISIDSQPEQFSTDSQLEQFLQTDEIIQIVTMIIKSGAIAYHDDSVGPIDPNKSEQEHFQNLMNNMTEDDIIKLTEIEDKTHFPMNTIATIYSMCDKNIDHTNTMINLQMINLQMSNNKLAEIDGVQYSTVQTSEFTQQTIKNGIILYERSSDEQSSNTTSNIVGFGDM